MKFDLAYILVIVVAIVAGRLLFERFLKPTPKEEVVKRVTSGDPVKDFLDNY